MNKQQLHKRLTSEQARNILAKYQSGELKAKEAINYLEISRSRFYVLYNKYESDPSIFSIEYCRETINRRISQEAEDRILSELKIEKEKIIDNPAVPTKIYNYSYIQNLLKQKHGIKVSVPTVINRAKENGFYKAKPPKKIHDREVITNYVGELCQHDSSHHLFAPDGKIKWYLITTIDDYSRKILFADFFLEERTWWHILALQSVILKYGAPLKYYPDQHSTFRYVKDRDKHNPWNTFTKFTDDIDPQWKQVLVDCKVGITYALSPQAKGKVERPYQWLQDHLVRTCVREGITNIEDAQKLLQAEVRDYNSKRVHSTTKEIPDIRFNKAIRENKTLFREFKLESPFQSAKDIFCLRAIRTVDSYRKISIKGCELKVPGVMPKQDVELRMYPDFKTGLIEVRFWHNGQFAGWQKVKITDLPIVQF
jgi:hypothetical protein